MKSYTLKIDLLSYWHAGSGHGAKADVDAMVLRDSRGFPYLPGRTLKGLLRDALLDMNCADDAGRLFGRAAEQGKNTGSVAGIVAVDDACMDAAECDWIESSVESDGLKAQLFESVASTAIQGSGVAVEKSLRLIEVALPMKLSATLTFLEAGESSDLHILAEACGLIRSLGSHRHRGLGRCRFNLIDTEV